MNREIKFRGKSINTGEWFESMTISKGNIKRKSNNLYLEMDTDKWVGVFAESVGQFTGLKDKNGKEIYEGDIVNTGKEKGVQIKWEAGNFWAGIYQLFFIGTSEVEVIGNIYENKELLN